MIERRSGAGVGAAAIAAAAVLGWASTAAAHHPMGGETPATLWHGLLSGLGHPIVGLDHFAFVVAVGLVSLAFAGRFLLPLAFVAATVVGTGIHLALIDLPGVEIVIALSVLLLGAALVFRTALPAWVFGGLFGLAGIFHGYAYGETVIGAEATPIVAYLVGFAAVQYAIAIGVMLLAERLWQSEALRAQWLRIAGGAVAGAGFVFVGAQLLPG